MRLVLDDQVVRSRVLPPELVQALRAARQLEVVADRAHQRERARSATGRLMLAAFDAGWEQQAVARAAGLKRTTAQKRIAAVRDRGMTGAGLDIPRPPVQAKTAPRSLYGREIVAPATERDWLTLAEAARYIDGPPSRVRGWRQHGFLPATRAIAPCWFLYSRTDLDRVMRAPRHPGPGRRIDHDGMRAVITLMTQPVPAR